VGELSGEVCSGASSSVGLGVGEGSSAQYTPGTVAIYRGAGGDETGEEVAEENHDRFPALPKGVVWRFGVTGNGMGMEGPCAVGATGVGAAVGGFGGGNGAAEDGVDVDISADTAGSDEVGRPSITREGCGSSTTGSCSEFGERGRGSRAEAGSKCTVASAGVDIPEVGGRPVSGSDR